MIGGLVVHMSLGRLCLARMDDRARATVVANSEYN